MAVALAAGLLLALAGEARGEGWTPATPLGLSVAGGEEWRAENDFDVFWTNPADAQVVGASWRLETGELVGATGFAAGFGIGELDGLRVPTAGAWSLTVWLREASGWESSRLGASVRLRLDDVPPTVAFMPGDADALPAQLVAAVADPLSGLADGTISYRRLDETRWSDLPTAIRAGAFGTELAAAAPELRPGTSYLFQAEARDNAGNLGTTTMRADGAPMEIAVPPGTGGRRAGGRGSRGRGDGTHGEGQRTRLLAGLAGGRGPGRGRKNVTVDAGEAALLRGALLDASRGSDSAGSDLDGSSDDRGSDPAGDDPAGGSNGRGNGLEGRRLRVVIQPARGSRTGRRVEPVTTGPGGRFALRLAPGPSRRIAVVFAGAEGLRPARRRLELRVRAAISLRATPRRLRTGGRLRLEGRVASRGARVPRAGKLVTISYWERQARRWRPVIVTRSDRGGRFRAAYRFRYVTGRARIRLRAEAPAEAPWPYAPGVSRPVVVEVRG